MTDSYSRQSPNSTAMDLGQKSSEEYLPHADNFHSEQDLSIDSASSQNNTLIPRDWNEQSHSGTISSSAVKVKTEPNLELGNQTCTSENNAQDIPTLTQNNTSTFKPAKIKRERLSLDSSVSSRSAHHFPTMDLGSHLELSLSSLQSGPDLTWSQLLEAKNLPKVYIPERFQRKAVVKNDKPGSDMELCSTDENAENQSLDVDADKSSTLEKSRGESGKDKIRGTGLSGSGAGLTSSRFSKNQDGGGGVLDLSKKVIPPEIRRVLASKYGVSKRYEDSHAGNVVPNFNKSRSRFTHSLRKTGNTDSEDEGNNRIETSKPEQLPSEEAIRGSDVQRSTTQPSTSSFQELKHSMPKSKSVSPTDYPVSQPVPAKLLHRRRFSSSTYERRKSEDRREIVTDKLQSRGLVDLGSHYGSLLKDSPPPLAGRKSGSPYDDSAALDRDADVSSALNKGVPQEQQRLRQSTFDDPNADPRTSGSRVAKGLPQGVRSSFAGGSSENLGSMNSRRDKHDHQQSNEARSLHVTVRNSKSPVDIESRNTEETMVDLSSRSRFGHRRDPLHSSARSSSR